MNTDTYILSSRTGEPYIDVASTSRLEIQSPVPPAGRVITFASLSRRVPEDRISERLARAVVSETGASVLLVSLTPHSAPLALSHWLAIAPSVNGHFHFGTQIEHLKEGFDRLSVHVSADPFEWAMLEGLVRHLRQHYAYVLLQVSDELTVRPIVECAILSEQAFLFLRQTAFNLCHLSVLTREIRSHPKAAQVQTKPILYLEDEEPAHDLKGLFEQVGGTTNEFSIEIAAYNGPHNLRYLRDRDNSFHLQIRGLAREIGHCRIGLALSSGGAKGLAHVGVIQVLEENGIEVDMLAGSSMGAYVASLWAYGCDGNKLEELALELEGRFGLWKLVDIAFPPRRGFIFGHTVKRRIQRTIGDAHFSDLVRPLRIIATHFDTLAKTVFAHGEVASAVHASSAIPGVCVPVEINGELYIDGGVTDPLPVDVLQDSGVEHIIAVNTIPTPSYLCCCLEHEREQREVKNHHWNALRLLNDRLNYFARGNILDIMMRAVHGSQIRVAEEACRQADVVLRPLACDAKWHDFTHPRKHIALGRRVAEEHLAEIKSLIKGAARENRTAQNKVAIAA